MSTTAVPDPDEFLDEGSAPPAVKFPKIGAGVKGEVIAAKVGFQRKFGSSEIDTWEDGTPKKQLMVDLRTADGDQRIYAKPACKAAIAEAVKASGGRLSDGGTLTVKRIEDDEPPQPGFNPRQQFKAKFEPKAVDTDLDDDDLDF